MCCWPASTRTLFICCPLQSSPSGIPVLVQYSTPEMTTPYTSTVRSLPSSPATSRQNSITSLASTQSEPARSSKSASSTTGSKFSSLFSKKHKQPKTADAATTPVLTSRFNRAATAATNKTLRDQQHQTLNSKLALNRKSGAPASTGQNTGASRHSTAYAHEQRRPHSGPPALRAAPGDSLPKLARIESSREPVEEGSLRNSNNSQNYINSNDNNYDGNAIYSTDLGKGGVPFEGSRDGSNNGNSTVSGSGNNTRPRARIAGRSFHRDETGRWTKRDTVNSSNTTSGSVSHPSTQANYSSNNGFQSQTAPVSTSTNRQRQRELDVLAEETERKLGITA